MATFAAAALLVGIGANAGSYAGSDTELKQDTLKTEERVPEHSIVDEVIWVVGDQPILKSDVEMMKLQGEMEGNIMREFAAANSYARHFYLQILYHICSLLSPPFIPQGAFLCKNQCVCKKITSVFM